MQAIELALLAAGKEGAPARILDVPCCHGHMAGVLEGAFPDADLTAGELDPAVDLAQVELGAGFDLVWCGCLLTHLDRDRWQGFLLRIAGALEDGGLFVFTALGRDQAERIRRGDVGRAMDEQGRRKILAEFERDGFGHAGYEGAARPGMSLTSPAWVCGQIGGDPSLQLVTYTERGWCGGQDVIAVTRI
jgi:SAM-dependent methyltransferase